MYSGNYRVRPLSFLGLYPDEDLRIGNDLFFRNEYGMFTAVENQMVEDGNQCVAFVPGLEIDNWTLEEVRFFSALYLGAGEYTPIALYPLPSNQDMFLPDVEELFENKDLLNRLMQEEVSTHSRTKRPEASAYNLSHFEKRAYSETRFQQAATFWENLNLDDAPLMRGLHSLLKSEMLMRHYQFLDASLSAVHIALDAAHASVLRRLKNRGAANPSSHDAMAYLESRMGYPITGLKFFQGYYEDRIRNFHTDSRFGSAPVPDFAVDDIIDLKSELKAVFFLLATREIHSDKRDELNVSRQDEPLLKP